MHASVTEWFAWPLIALQAVECEELPGQHVHQLLDQLLQRDLQPLLLQQQQLGDAGQQFVMARALLVGAELREVATQHHKECLLTAAATAGERPQSLQCWQQALTRSNLFCRCMQSVLLALVIVVLASSADLCVLL